MRKKGGAGYSSTTLNIPREVLWGVGGGLVLLMLAVHLLIGVTWLGDMARLAGDKANWQKLSLDRNILDAVNNESQELKKKIAVISDMTSKGSVAWSPKLNAISDALPRGVWLRRMVLDKTSLTMEGSAVSKNHNEIADVGNFVSALKKEAVFMKDFSSLEVNSIQRGKRSSMEVADFTITAKLKTAQTP